MGDVDGQESPAREPAIPGATYRLQLNREFTFADVERIVPYLDRLGVTHCYLSPYLKARAGSSHGYDVTDHGSINDEIGTSADFAAMSAALRAAGMGQIADIVPNHMAIMGSDSLWWLDVLENGEASPYAEYFDIDWHPVRPELGGKVLVPVLGDHYGTVLEQGDLRLTLEPGTAELAIHYHDHKLPLDPGTYPAVLGLRTNELGAVLGTDSQDYAEYLSIVHSFEQLPSCRETTEAKIEERRREKEVAKQRLAALLERCAPVKAFVEANRAHVAGRPGQPESFAALHALLERQPWRVAYWQVAADEINYRRFFDINELGALRVERPEVFRATHKLVLQLYRDGHIDGLRIDHPDGLYDPEAYFASLQDAVAAATPERADGPLRRGVFIVCEKILAAHEYLREDWVVDGTTGYDFAFLCSGLTVLADAERAMERCYRSFTGEHVDFDDVLYACKKLVIRVHLSSELTTLANLLNRVAQASWHTRDFTLNGLRDALTEVVACFPVYRTYVTPRGVASEDRSYVEWAVSWARRRDPRTNDDVYDFIEKLLLLDIPPDVPAAQRLRCERFAMKFQQYTAPVMAKALEDTCFYRYVRLASLCEVGADPRRFGISVAAFHHQNRARQRRWPHGLLAGSTHDNKRSEDVRARLNVLTEMPNEWAARIRRWRRLTRRWRRQLDDGAAPTRRDEYLYYQTLLGIWPAEPPDGPALADLTERVAAYMLKAIREAKERTSWMHPDEDYERAVEGYVRNSLDPGHDRGFAVDVGDFAARIAPFGWLNGLSQTALRLTAPGVPDIYQGDEVWDLSLVDPDNRRPVDYPRRARLLDDIEQRIERGAPLASLVEELLGTLGDGRLKLFLIWRLLGLRRARRELFDHGEYVPLATSGARANHICAFARRYETSVAVVAAGRWFVTLQGGARTAVVPPPAEAWGDTSIELPPDVSALRNVLTGTVVAPAAAAPAAELLAPLPIAVLVGDAAVR